MIIGNGMLAKAFSPFLQKDDVIIFASGVSNSQEFLNENFYRERKMLEECLELRCGRFVYFSSCSIYDSVLSDTPYVKHKKNMELLVTESPSYTIFRLPQVLGNSKNPSTLANFIYSKINKNEHFNIWENAKRNLIDVVDVFRIAESILDAENSKNQTINIAAPHSVKILELVEIFERLLSKKAQYTTINSGSSYQIDTKCCARVADGLGISFKNSYLERIIYKYYEQRCK